jgi:hypothetical protein
MHPSTIIASALALACLAPIAHAQQPFPLEPGGSSAHGDSAMSFDGANFLVFFEDDRGIPGNRELYAMFVSPAGVPQTPMAFMVSSGPYTGYPDACFGGGQHLVAYEGAWGGGAVPQIICTRILPDGTVLDPNGIAVWSNQQTAHAFRPQVASNGQQFCIAWGDDLLYPGEKPLQFAILGLDGAVEFGPANIPFSDLASVLNTDMTTDGTNFILVWESDPGLMVTRISPTGAILSSQLVHSSSNYWMQQPRIGYNGESFLVSWYWWPGGVPTLSSKRISLAGAALGGVINIPNATGIPISILRSGPDFLLFRTGASSGPNPLIDLLYTQISATGTVGPSTTYLSGYNPGVAAMPSMAMGSGGTVLSAVSLAMNTFEPPRMHGQILQVGSPAPACYANCDDSTTQPVLNVADFSCFLQRFAAGESYANCDQSTQPPILNVADFSCFLQKFAAGCP